MLRPLTGYGHEVNIVVEGDLCGLQTGGLYGRGQERERGCGDIASTFMDSGDETIIGVGKTKVVPLLLGSAAFVAIGILMLTLDDAAIQSRRGAGDSLFVRGLGLAAILFFGSFALYALKKLFDKKPALIFNSSGLIDNASSISAGFIPWSEVLGAEIVEIEKQKLLVIEVAGPEQYIARGNSLQRKLNQANYNLVGSPISITANTLEISFSELISLFNRYRRKYGVRPGYDDMRPDALAAQGVRSPEAIEDHAAHVDDFRELETAPKAGLFNWSPFAVRGTIGSGGIGIFVLLVSSLDMLFHIQISFWVAITISLLPMFIFFLAVPDFFPSGIVGPAQWFAVGWYLIFAALSISLAAYRGLTAIEVYLAGFIMLGVWACLVAARKLRAAREN